jgi:hypothetical protein
MLMQFGVLLATALVLYGKARFPETSLISVTAVLSVLSLYGVAGWLGQKRLIARPKPLARIVTYAGLVAGLIFATEITLEYVVLPANNTPFGWVEFGLVFTVYFGVGVLVAYSQFSLHWSMIAGAATAVISSLIWYIVLLACFYVFFGTERQAQVFRAEGNYEDFHRSGMANFNKFMMEDFFGAGFFHLLLGPIAASLLAGLGGLVGMGVGRLRKKRLDP